jgi:hypothetical protein
MISINHEIKTMTDIKPEKPNTVADIENYYWLKSHLIDLCRQQGIPADGSKEALKK